ELVALQRPVLDCEGFALAQRAEAAGGLRGVLHRDRSVVKIARDPRFRCVRTARDDAEAWYQHDSGAYGVDRELPGLMVDVHLVVVAVPSAVFRDSLTERVCK